MSRKARKLAAAQAAAGSSGAPLDEVDGAEDEAEDVDLDAAEARELEEHLADAATPLVDENGEQVNPPDAMPNEEPGEIDHGDSGPPASLEPDAPVDETVVVAPASVSPGLTRYVVHAFGTVQHNDVEYKPGEIVALPAHAVAHLVAEGTLVPVE